MANSVLASVDGSPIVKVDHAPTIKSLFRLGCQVTSSDVSSLLQSYERMNLADALIAKTYEDSETMFSQGDIGDGMYFVEEGQVAISMAGNDGIERQVIVSLPETSTDPPVVSSCQCSVQVTSIEKGGYFGELALVTHKPRAATAKAVGKVRLACKCPSVLQHIQCIQLVRTYERTHSACTTTACSLTRCSCHP